RDARMKDIQKGREPPSLTQHRQARGSFEDPGPWKQDLKRALLREQGALCCYCMGRIDLDAMKVEHWRAQHGHRDSQLKYRNLLGACSGSQQNPTHEGHDIRHCDTSKGSRPLQLDPVAGVEHKIRYGFAEGRIFSDDPAADHDLDKILNLNAQNLRRSRQAVIQALCEGFAKKYPKAWSAEVIEREIQRWSSRDGEWFRP